MSPELATIKAWRAAVALQIARHVARGGQTQAAAARQLCIPQPTLRKVMRGKVATVSLVLLLRIAVRARQSLDLQKSANPAEAGAYLATTTWDKSGRLRSRVSRETRSALVDSVRAMSPAERLEAYVRHNEFVAALYSAGRKPQAGSRRPGRND